MNRKYSLVKPAIVILLFSFGLFACSMPAKILPNAEFNALMVDADAAIQDGHWQVAQAKLDQAAILQPNNLNVKLKQGLAYQLGGKMALAHNAYQQIIDAEPKPGGRAAEIVRAAKTNQVKLGFKSLDSLKEEIPSPAKLEANDSERSLAPDSIEAKALIAEVAAVNEPEPVPATAEVTQDEQIAARINDWLSAWEQRRVSDYLSFYEPGFAGNYASHAEWRKQRTARVNAAKGIQIRISELKIEQHDSETALATFIQQYRSADHTDTGLKTLQLKKVNDSWLIMQEQFSKQ